MIDRGMRNTANRTYQLITKKPIMKKRAAEIKTPRERIRGKTTKKGKLMCLREIHKLKSK